MRTRSWSSMHGWWRIRSARIVFVTVCELHLSSCVVISGAIRTTCVPAAARRAGSTFCATLSKTDLSSRTGVKCPPQSYIKMPCPVCNQPPASGADHRWCLVELFKTNRIKSVNEWEELCKPKTIIKGKKTVRIPKE